MPYGVAGVRVGEAVRPVGDDVFSLTATPFFDLDGIAEMDLVARPDVFWIEAVTVCNRFGEILHCILDIATHSPEDVCYPPESPLSDRLRLFVEIINESIDDNNA
jgi:hypothetical protein